MLKAAEKSVVFLRVVLLVLLAVSFLPIGGDSQASLKAYDVVAYDEKISPGVKEQLAGAVFEKKDKINVIVRSSSDVDSAVKGSRGKIKDTAKINEMTFTEVEISPGKVARLAEEEKVEKIYPVIEYYLMLDESVQLTNAKTFWDAGYKGNGVKVAVLDTGIDKNHPMLAGKVVAEKDFSNSGSASDKIGHGTHVAGIMAGTTASGGKYDGVAPGAQLLNGKVIGDDEKGDTSSIISAIAWAVDNGADVISMSLGAPEPLDLAMDDAIREAVASGVVVVVSSGNCGNGCPSYKCGSFRGVTSPGSSPSVISVGAVDKNNQAACFSSGENIQGVGVKPDIVAPGVSITSSVLNSGYQAKDGTSMSAPHISGAAALILQKNPELTPSDVKHLLEETSVDLGQPGKDTSYGSGMIDLKSALNFYSDIEFTVNFEKQLSAGSAQQLEVKIFDDIPITGVSGKVKKPDDSEKSFSLNEAGTNSYSYGYSDTAIMGDYSLEIEVRYKPTLESSDEQTGQQKSAFYSGMFRVISPAGNFGNIEAVNIAQEQFYSKNLTGSLEFRSTSSSGLEISILLQLLKNASEGRVYQEIRLPAKTVAAGSASTIPVNNAIEANPGSYTLKILTDYGAGSIMNETNITVTDDLAPEFRGISYNSDVLENSPVQFFINLKEHSDLSKVNISVWAVPVPCAGDCPSEGSPFEIPVIYSVKNLSKTGNEKEFGLTIFEGLNRTDNFQHEATINACDTEGNCAASSPLRLNVKSCDGKGLLIVKTYEEKSVFEEAASSISNVCLSVLNRSLSTTPPSSYLERFDAVVWSAGTDLVNIDDDDAEALIDYYNKKGRLIVEGSDVAFRHGNDEFMREVLHAALKNDLGFTVTSSEGLSNLSINATRPNPLLKGMQDSLPFNATLDPFPDSVTAYNGGVELAAWTGADTNGSAIVAYESDDGTKKSLLLPFDITALDDDSSGMLAANAFDWLLEDSTVDVTPLEIKYGNGEYPLIAKEIAEGGFCIMMCYPVWELEGGTCKFNSCGSPCKIDNTTTFVREEECELAKDYFAGKGNGIIVEGEQFTSTVITGSKENLSSPLKVNVMLNGKVVSEGIAKEGNGKSGDYNVTYDYGFSTALEAGQHTATVFANSDFSITENNYANNIKDFTFTVYPKLPDLKFTAMNYSYDESKGLTIANLNVSNSGGTDAATSIKVYLDGSEKDKKDIILKAGETKAFGFELPSGKGAYSFRAVIDPGDSVGEYNESNNEWKETIYLCSKEKVLVIEDNDAEFYSTAAPSSAGEFVSVLRSNSYCVNLWNEAEQGTPSPEFAETFPLVIWSAGDYFENITDYADRGVLRNYGNSLILEGSDIAMDFADEDGLFENLSGSLFSKDVLMNKAGLVLKNHPITEEISSITIDKGKAPYPDGVEAVNAEVVAEWQDGSAAITAYQGSGRKLAYYAFSADAVTNDSVRERLILNTVQWMFAPQKPPKILEVSGVLRVNESKLATIRVEAEDEDTSRKGLTLEVNDSRFKRREAAGPFSQLAPECGGIAGLTCPEQKICELPVNCLDCFGLCHITTKSLIEFFDWQTSYSDAGNYSVKVTVSDENSADYAVANITVLAGNRAPSATLNADFEMGFAETTLTVNEGDTKNFSVIATDPDGDALTYRWLLNGTVVSATQNFSFSPKHNESGTYNLSIVVSDGQAETSIDFKLIVLDTMDCAAGKKQLCPIQLGVCSGSAETCDSKGKWPGCKAADYLSYSSKYEANENSCDGLDNDCDGKADEGFEDLDSDGTADCVDTDLDNDGVEDEEDNVIGREDDIGFKGEAKNIKIGMENDEEDENVKKVRINNSKKPLVEFSYNFSKGKIFLKNVSIEKQNESDSKGYTIVKGLKLKGGTKSVFVDRLIEGSNAVCVKDNEVSELSEVNDDCSGDSESLLTCQLDYSMATAENGKLSCRFREEPRQFMITGLQHSAVLELCTDADGDGHLPVGCSSGLDCNDNNSSVSPAAEELCNGVDDNCNGLADENRVCNTPPQLQLIGNRTIQENKTLNFTISTTDNEGDNVTYNATGLPPGASFDNSTAKFTWTPDFEQAGTYYGITFNASDGLESDYETINITVTNVNRQPRFENLTNQTAFENATLIFFANATDPDNDSLEFVVEVPQKVGTAKFDSKAMQFTWTPTFDDAGDYKLLFRANDSQSSASAEVNVTVLNVNRAPEARIVLDPPGLSVNEGEVKLLKANASDPDGDTLTYKWLLNGTVVSATQNFSFSPKHNESGTYNLTMVVSDGKAEAGEEILIAVLDTLECAAGKKQLCPIQLGVCSGSAETCDSKGKWPGCKAADYLSYSSKYEANENSCDGLDNDCDGLADENRVCNTPPQLQLIGNKTIQENKTLNFTISASDKEGDALTYNATKLPRGAAFDNSTAKFTWTPDFEQAGTYYGITFNASDGMASYYETINITVTNVNRQPRFENLTNQTVLENSTLRFFANATDMDNEPLLFTVEAPPKLGGYEFDAKLMRFTWTPTFDDAGDYELRFTASDGQYLAAEKVNITVINVNRPPKIGLVMIDPPTLVMGEGETKRFSTSIADEDGDAVKVEWKVDGKAASTSPVLSFTASYDDSGKHNIELSVSDSVSTSSTKILLTVQDTMDCAAGKKQLCPIQPGVCSGSAETCDSKGKWPGCKAADYLSYSSKYEANENSCDGLDNDCDGKADEGFEDLDSDGTANCVDADEDGDGIPNGQDKIAGNALAVKSNIGRNDLKVEVGGKSDLKQNLNSVTPVKIMDKEKPVVELDFDFSKNKLRLDQVMIDKENLESKVGFVIINWLGMDSVKTVYVNQLLPTTRTVCVKDAEISSVSEITAGCTGAAEKLLNCDGANNGGYSCALDNKRFKVSGLKHSGVLETCPDTDADAYTASYCGGSDCDDSNKNINLAAKEACNKKDDDCDGSVDEERVCNTEPKLQPIGNKKVSENQQLSFTVTAADAEGDKLEYTASPLPAGAAFDASTATFTWKPGFDQAGTYQIKFSAGDGLLSSSETLAIEVTDFVQQLPPPIMGGGGGGGGGGGRNIGDIIAACTGSAWLCAYGACTEQGIQALICRLVDNRCANPGAVKPAEIAKTCKPTSAQPKEPVSQPETPKTPTKQPSQPIPPPTTQPNQPIPPPTTQPNPTSPSDSGKNSGNDDNQKEKEESKDDTNEGGDNNKEEGDNSGGGGTGDNSGSGDTNAASDPGFSDPGAGVYDDSIQNTDDYGGYDDSGVYDDSIQNTDDYGGYDNYGEYDDSIQNTDDYGGYDNYGEYDDYSGYDDSGVYDSSIQNTDDYGGFDDSGVYDDSIQNTDDYGGEDEGGWWDWW